MELGEPVRDSTTNSFIMLLSDEIIFIFVTDLDRQMSPPA